MYDESKQEIVSTDVERSTTTSVENARMCPCGRPVPQNRKIYCSLKCKKLGPRVDNQCIGCGRVFPARKCALKEGRGGYCSRECSDAHARSTGRQAGPNNPRWVDGRWLARKKRWPAQMAAQAHHDDYSRPLDVRWLCCKHHKEVHRELRAAGIDPMERVSAQQEMPDPKVIDQ